MARNVFSTPIASGIIERTHRRSRKGFPATMQTPFSPEDLGRVFDAATLTKARTLILARTVEVALRDTSISVVIEHLGRRHVGSITPSMVRHRVVFATKCDCGHSSCAHLAAGALAALDRYPALRKPTQQNFLETLRPPSSEERQRVVFELSPSEPPHACVVSLLLVGERTGRIGGTTPARGSCPTAPIPRACGSWPNCWARATQAAPRSHPARSRRSSACSPEREGGAGLATGCPLTLGEERTFEADAPPKLPPRLRHHNGRRRALVRRCRDGSARSRPVAPSLHHAIEVPVPRGPAPRAGARNGPRSRVSRRAEPATLSSRGIRLRGTSNPDASRATGVTRHAGPNRSRSPRSSR